MRSFMLASLVLSAAAIVWAPRTAHADGFKSRERVEGPAPLVATPLPELRGGEKDPVASQPAGPVQRQVVTETASDGGLRIDTSGFTGGVGTDIASGFIAGGGRVIHRAGDGRFASLSRPRTGLRIARRTRFIARGRFSGGHFSH